MPPPASIDGTGAPGARDGLARPRSVVLPPGTDAAGFRLLNDWQRGFPLLPRPFAALGAQLGMAEDAVIAAYRRWADGGLVGRIGAVFAPHRLGASALAALAVPPARLAEAAERVSAEPGVNHNYEREHRYNLWFVMTGRDDEAVARAVDGLESQTGCRALRLRMQRAYRIDLGFDLRRSLAQRGGVAAKSVAPVAEADRPLAALVEEGLPLVEQPFDVWAAVLGCTRERVLETLRHWLVTGTLRRFGVIVQHHEVGFAHNAMTVFDVPDHVVDGLGGALAGAHGVTLAYRRRRAEGWPYNLYCMVHGRDRTAVCGAIDAAVEHCGLGSFPRVVLFSRRRFKQTGARYFRPLPEEAAHA